MSEGTPLRQARGLGAAGSGTGHWWRQRTTSLALIPLTIFLVLLVASLVGAAHAEAVARIGHPAVALALVVTLAATAWHMKLGMQVIVEDYVHREGWKLALLIANGAFSLAVTVIGAFAVLKLSFGG
jgi:succinate dehydrogenase / fumarate reductase membrane anchor subunit